MPKISVIITLTAPENIASVTFESLTQQTFNDFECLFVQQNKSEPYTSLLSLPQKDNRFKLIKSQNENPSKWDCYNDALYQVKGEYILFLNDTDILHNQALDIFSDALRYTHSQIAAAHTSYFSARKEHKKKSQKIMFDKSVLKKKNQNILADFLQGNALQINGAIEGKMFLAETVSYLKFHSKLNEFAPYFFMEQFYSLTQSSVYVKYPLYFLRKEAHIPSLSSYETLTHLKERIVFEYAYFIESGRVNGYNAIVLKRKASQDLFNAVKHVVLHTPESNLICINQQLINLLNELKENYDMLQGLSLSLMQKVVLLTLSKNNLALTKKLLKIFY